MNNLPVLLVLSSPSGGGKTETATILRQHFGFTQSISATTRTPRPGEVNGVHYHFLSREEFKKRERDGKFIETAEIYGHLYGTLCSSVTDALKRGEKLVLTIDVQGHASIRECRDELIRRLLVSVFILPPSLGELERRLRMRPDMKAASAEDIARRLKEASAEIARAGEFTHTVINHTDPINKSRAVAREIDFLCKQYVAALPPHSRSAAGVFDGRQLLAH